jgi:hypothetical protein
VIPSEPEPNSPEIAASPDPALGAVTASGRDDHRPFAGQSHVPPLQRLARFRATSDPEDSGHRDNTVSQESAATSATQPVGDQNEVDARQVAEGDFRPVEAEELSAVPRVYVFVHGWLPGSKDSNDALFAEQGQVDAWDDRVSNTVGRTLLESYSPLLVALADRDPAAAVLWFSWVDQSGTDAELFAARDSFANTEVNGRRLAIALQEAFGDGLPELQIIGHSHGCVVSTHASLALSHPPRHLTLLDCPEDWFSRAGGAAGLLDNILPRLQPGRGTSPTFVDSYASMFGHAYHSKPGLDGVVDVRLTPTMDTDDEASPVSQAHQYPVAWYAGTVLDPDCEYGFGWSPMLGADTNELSAAYLKAFDGPMIPIADYDADPQDSATTYLVEQLAASEKPLTNSEPDLAFSVAIDPSVVFVEFDYDVRWSGRQTVLEVAADRQLKFVAKGKSKVPSGGRYLRLDPGSSDRVALQFRVVDPGLLTSITVQRLRLVRENKLPKNYDDRRAAMAIAGLGAAAGAAATLVGVGLVVGIRRIFRSRN